MGWGRRGDRPCEVGRGGELREIDLGKVRHRLTSVILAVRRMKQGDCQEFKVSLEYIACFRPA